MERLVDFPENKIQEKGAAASSILIKLSLLELGRRLKDYEVYLFGSLGRRMAMSGANNWNEYCEAIAINPSLSPRKNKTADKFDIDIAVNKNSIDWQPFASIAKQISLSNPHVEIDPHFVDILTGGKFFKPKGFKTIPSKHASFDISCHNFKVDETFDLMVPDRWSQLLIYFSAHKIRQKDVSEIERLMGSMVKHHDFDDKEKTKLAIAILTENSNIINPREFIRLCYLVSVPQKLRTFISGVRNEKIVRFNPVPNYESQEPVYF